MSGPSQFNSFYQFDDLGRYLDIAYLNSYFSNPDSHRVKAGFISFTIGFGKYRVYEDGFIFSVSRSKIYQGQFDNDGYLRVSLSIGNRISKMCMVHTLVAFSFVNGYDPYSTWQINHIDENKSNNHHTNLEWSTMLFNNQYGTRTANGIRTAQHSRSYPVRAINLDGTLHKEYPLGMSSAIRDLCPYKAIRLPYVRSAVSRIQSILGSRNQWHGFRWERV